MKHEISQLLDFADSTYYKWKKEKRPIIELLEKCFTEQELEQFLATKEVPYKIQFANKYFASLNEECTKYLISSPGAKALMYVLIKKTIDENTFSVCSFPTLNDVILQEYENKRLSRTDIIDYFDNQPSEQLLLYILDNARQNWNLYLSSIENNQKWLIIYFQILLLSVQLNCYDKIFKHLGGYDGDGYVYNYSAIPKPPISKIGTTKESVILEHYENILLNVKKALETAKINELNVYDNTEEFNLNLVPLKDENNKIVPLKEAETYLRANNTLLHKIIQ